MTIPSPSSPWGVEEGGGGRLIYSPTAPIPWEEGGKEDVT